MPLSRLLKYVLCGFVLFVNADVLLGQSAKKFLKSGDKLFEAKQYRDAYEQYQLAGETDPQMYDAYLGMGKSLYQMGRKEEAFSEFQRAAAFGPKEAPPFFYLGKIHSGRKEWNEAVSNLQQAAENDRKNAEILEALFRAQTHTGQFEIALETANELRKADKNAHSQYILGVALDSLKRYDEAEEKYREARFEDPLLIEAYLGTANVRLARGEFQRALEDCNKAIEKNSISANAFRMRSRVNMALKNYSGAIDDLTAVMELEPENMTARRSRAEAYRTKGQHQSAIADLSAIIEKHPDDFEALYKRAASYEAVTDYRNAIRDYERLRKLSPYDDRAAQMLEAARQRLFNLNRETGLPDIELTSHIVNEYGEVEIPNNQSNTLIKGRVIDESPILSMSLNDSEISVSSDSVGPAFEHSLDASGLKQLVFRVEDIYNNENRILYKIRRTEVNPPEVQLLAPYSSDDGKVSITGNISDISIEGRVRDESVIRSITINGVNASFITDKINPKFNAQVRIANQSQLKVSVEDIFGNRTEERYEIDRSGLLLSGDNPMGKTWVVFIENSNYNSFASIDGPEKDVNMMKQAFAGYHIHNVIHKKDMTKTEMERFFAIELRDLVRSNEVTSLLVWFAGHGKHINNTGYWIPVDANRDDEFSFFNINSLKAAMMAYSNYLTHTLVVTDACESGPSFAEITREELPVRRCDDWEAARMKSSQVFSSAGYELASDHSQFTRTFSNMLNSNPDACLPIENVVVKVSEVVKKQGNQSPKFGVIDGLGDENGTFFFMRKTN